MKGLSFFLMFLTLSLIPRTLRDNCCCVRKEIIIKQLTVSEHEKISTRRMSAATNLRKAKHLMYYFHLIIVIHQNFDFTFLAQCLCQSLHTPTLIKLPIFNYPVLHHVCAQIKYSPPKGELIWVTFSLALEIVSILVENLQNSIPVHYFHS